MDETNAVVTKGNNYAMIILLGRKENCNYEKKHNFVSPDGTTLGASFEPSDSYKTNLGIKKTGLCTQHFPYVLFGTKIFMDQTKPVDTWKN